MKNEIVLYNSEELTSRIEVRIEEDTVWLNRQQIATLFGRDVKTIGKHINNVFKEGELEKSVVVANFATTTQHGAIEGKTQTITVEHYNLDVIISVGYRIKSKQGTQFRIWANNILKDYLLKGYALNQRINRIETTVDELAEKVKLIDLQINTNAIPVQGIFYDGQIFDAYEFISRIIRTANNSIVLLDNYIDESVLVHLAKKRKGVKVLLLTKNYSKQLLLDVRKANEQYSSFEVQSFASSHDRFLIIDNTDVYHLGASIKDLGKKWFAFSKLDKSTIEMLLTKINEAQVQKNK